MMDTRSLRWNYMIVRECETVFLLDIVLWTPTFHCYYIFDKDEYF